MTDEEAEALRWREALRQGHGEDAVYASRDACIRWALARERSGDDPAAIAAWREAQERQWTIGTWSTGSGEGLSSMRCVYELMVREAAVHERIGTAAAHEAERALLARVASDPNGLGPDVLGDRNDGTQCGLTLPPLRRSPRGP